MKTKNIFKLLFTLALTVVVVNCGYNEDLIEELSISREFAPVDLRAIVRNQVNVELNWRANDDVNTYVAEFSTDPNFGSIEETVEILGNELPALVPLEGETLYYIRVKAVSSRGLDDSTWATAQAQTLTEQIFISSEPGDIGATQAILRWIPNSAVTTIEVSPGNISHVVTDQEKIDGVATITGLTGETEYTAQIMNGTRIRGITTFTTGIDVGDNTLVMPEDDLFQIIADAEDGDILILEQGDYTSQVGSITLNKSITIQGLRTDFKPQLKVSFSIGTGAIDVSLIDLDLTGDVAAELTDVVRYTEADNFNSLLIKGCNIHDYDRSFIAGSVTDGIVQNVTVEDCVVTNVMTNGGDFIDFRNSDALNLSVTTSTFNNCAPGRDFIRMDNAGTLNDTGVTANILIDQCTIYACSNSDSRRLLYVRFVSNDVTVTNTLITETASEGYADRAGIDETPTFGNNNYFNAPGFYNSSQYIYDNTNYTTLDPQFSDPSSGDFTIANQDLIDNGVGDPRWR